MIEHTSTSPDDPVEVGTDEVALSEQLDVPAAVQYKTHPMVPYAEPAFRVVLRGKTYLVKESDLALIDLTPAHGRRWRNHGVCDYRVGVHRGWMAPPKPGKSQGPKSHYHRQSLQYIPYNPANLGFLDASRNKQISATYELDVSKVKIDHKHWREHLQLIRQWHKVDVIINDEIDVQNWARKNSKRMHPLIRTWYRMKRVADRLEALVNESPQDSALLKRYGDVVAKQMDVALKIENQIATTSRYIDNVLEQRIRERDRGRASGSKPPILEADAEVMEEGFANMRLQDVDKEMARVMAKYTGDAEEMVELETNLSDADRASADDGADEEDEEDE